MDIKKLMQERFAAKGFGRKATGEKIEELLEIIRLSPSSYNTQPWRVFVVENRERKDLMDAAFGQRQIMEASHILVFCYVRDRERLVKDLAKMDRELAERIKGIVYGMEQEEYECWAKAQVYIALGIALAAAASLSIDSCPMEGFEPGKWRDLLGMDEGLEPAVLLALGREGYPRKEKKRLAMDDILIGRD